MSETTEPKTIKIEDQDIAAAQNQLITQLLNENLTLRATINRMAREGAE